MTFGLTEDGFIIKRESDLIAELEDGFKSAFGNIRVDAASTAGQEIGVLSKPLAELWELLEAVYLSQYPASAEGVSLDGVVTLTGITRLGATKSFVEGIIEGDQATNILAGFQASVSDTREIFETTEDITIDNGSVKQCKISIDSVLDSTLYTVLVNATVCGYTSDSDATAQEIIDGLLNSINTLQSEVTAVDNGDETLTLTVDDLTTTFLVDLSTELQFDYLGAGAQFRSVNTGEILSVAGTLTIIETPIAGVTGVNNLVDGTLGDPVENDIDLRTRRERSLRISGASTIEAIEANLLQEVADVTSAKVVENDTISFNDTIVVSVDTVLDSTEYSVYLNGIKFSITSDSDATAEEIALALVNVINLGSLAITATDNTNGTFDIDPDTTGVLYSVNLGTGLSRTGAQDPKTIQAIVVGGTDTDVALKLWDTKAGGIGTFGNTSKVIQDSQGDDHTINFTRPVFKYAWFQIVINTNPEEDFPIDGAQQIKDNIIEFGESNFGIGDDFILQKIYNPIYQVDGISSATLEIAITDLPGGSPVYGSVNISIDITEVLAFLDGRISVSVDP